ncbi:uncharacterized protein CANTADRAFT_54577 [Suhomyces tanzawaensis NRRL Y-17324]|uniref:Pre-mRNA-splicing factor SYF1 n=1 Tax=Suhomyces tanzawaensis NRRL Y-17324 TaxID=984487 RepID=A0A1E4SEV2_9ASCO|nr:uncharacterized protein CANTADRAFT_54577 [Suhomyces tanzawaensis NRRL Y-17324]ODV78013.1 hypothetical protein CANTADRAFT_54577 [Suhomyces tanzawaensis NRRL Y-17324]
MNYDDWTLDRLVAPADMALEHELAKNPHDLASWQAYYRLVEAAETSPESVQKKLFVLERAVQAVPRSAEMWLLYTDVAESLVEHASYYHHRSDFGVVNSVYERALLLLADNHQLWQRYLRFLTSRQQCEVTFIRRRFNRALLCLKGSVAAIWQLYLAFGEAVGGLTACHVWSKYLQYLGGVEHADGGHIVLVLAQYVQNDQYLNAIALYRAVLASSRDLPVSRLQLLNEYLEVLVDLSKTSPSASLTNHFELAVKDAIALYPDQLGPLYLQLTQFMTEQGHHAKSRHYYNQAILHCDSVRDFVMIFDAWTQFEESRLTELSEAVENNNTDEAAILDALASLDFRMNYLDNLISNRPFLLNDMMIRKDPNNLDHWFQRIDLHKDNLDKVLPTYAQALTQINPLKAHSGTSNTLPKLWINYARVYSSRDDWKTANLIFSKSVTSTFRSVDELVDLYIEWTESNLSAPFKDADTKALYIVQQVLFENKSKDELHASVSKNLRLWSFYIDLLQSFIEDDEKQAENIDRVCDAYTKMIDIKIASPKTILSFASFLQLVNYNERSLAVYESGLRLFTDSELRFEIWNVYLSKAISFGLDIERTRDLFDTCLFENNGCPASLAKPFILLYSNFERDHGFVLKSLKVIKQGIKKLSDGWELAISKEQRSKILNDKFDLYTILFISVEDIETKRGLYEEAVEDSQLSLDQLIRLSDEFIDFEVQQKQISRARGLFKFICKLCNPKNNSLIRISQIWAKWETFEVDHGDEITYKEMLRFKRTVVDEFEKVSKFNEQLNPMGFVKGETVGGAKDEEEVRNPEEIDMDM